MCAQIRKNLDLALKESAKKLLNVTEKDVEYILLKENMTHKAVEDKVQIVREWYLKQHHLPQGQLRDDVILHYLIKNDFKTESVKQRIDNYFTARTKIPEFVANQDPTLPLIEKYMKSGYWTILPKKTPENHRIVMFRMDEPVELSMLDFIKVIVMLSEYRLVNEVTEGDHYILDYKHSLLSNAVQVTPPIIQKVIFWLLHCIKDRIKGIHIVNLPAHTEFLLAIFKKSMKDKILKRIRTYNNIEEVLKMFPRNIFPKELGGDEISFQEIANNWVETFHSPAWKKYFEQTKVLTDESKRLSPSIADEIFGLQGSFRQLQVD